MDKRTTRVSRPKTGKEVEAAGACGHDDISGAMKTHVTTALHFINHIKSKSEVFIKTVKQVSGCG
jgi:hypothetical protein